MKLQLVNYINVKTQEIALADFDNKQDLIDNCNSVIGQITMLYDCIIINSEEYNTLYKNLLYCYMKKTEKFEK